MALGAGAVGLAVLPAAPAAAAAAASYDGSSPGLNAVSGLECLTVLMKAWHASVSTLAKPHLLTHPLP